MREKKFNITRDVYLPKVDSNWPLTFLFGIHLYVRPVLLGTQVSDIGPSLSSCH